MKKDRVDTIYYILVGILIGIPTLPSLICCIIICSIFIIIYIFENTLPFIKKTRKKIQEYLWQIVCYLFKYICEIILESDKEENITNIDNLVEKVIKERSLDGLSYYEKEKLLEFLQNPKKSLNNETLIFSSRLATLSKSSTKLMKFIVFASTIIILYSIILSSISIVIVILTGIKFSFAYFSINWIMSSCVFALAVFGRVQWQYYLLAFYLPVIVYVMFSMIINTALIFKSLVQ
ncbi:MAG: hypothetical protein F6K54_02570 [Okeania sp. SIO3B5]|uniref:hypothetical protein n=1 Tax=Okeania sp. SIO3B5 TaxID=2607811 RepID=UPI0013FECE2A|nr:hypothetical protein [Okeania sp. SIO3B5]NEO52061.1 hypothetical protein [Okeania sp. SIO3B5]